MNNLDKNISFMNNLDKNISFVVGLENIIKEVIVMSEEIEKYKDDILDLENERDILKSKLSETKADIHYLLENGESIYIKNKYIRGDNNE